MKTRKQKKGFTIVELVIVLAVVGVLAAILIPTFTNIINKANTAKDQSLVYNLNEALILEEIDHNGKYDTMHDTLTAMDKNQGFGINRIKVTSKNSEILWDSVNNRFVMVTKNGNTTPTYYNGTDEINYPVLLESENKLVTEVDLWKITDTFDANSPYSTYYTGDATTVTTSKGFDAGNSNVTTVNYNGIVDEHDDPIPQNVVIRTNSASTILTIDAEHDTVNHYGEAGFLNIVNVNTSSYHEFGYVPQAQLSQGRIVNEVYEEGKAGVQNLFLVAATESSFSEVIVGAAEGAKLPALDRTDVTIPEGGVLVVKVEEGVKTTTTTYTTTNEDYVYLYKSGIKEQVLTSKQKVNNGSITGNIGETVQGTATAGGTVTFTVGTTAIGNGDSKTAAEEIANIAKGTVTDYNSSEIEVEQKATLEDLEKSQGEDALFAGGAGTKNNPYLIATPEQFLKIESGTESNPKYYLMISDIDFDDATYTPKKLGADPFNAWCLLSNSLATQVKDIHFNGGGHDLSLSLNDCDVQGANRLCLFAYLGGTSVLENFNIVIDNYQTGEHCFFTLVDYSGYASEDHLTFKDITTKSNDPNVVISGSLYNNGIFTSQTFYGKVDFINCDNYVNLNGTNNKYYAPYIGGYIQSYSQVSFTDCDNYGNLSGVGSAAMFIGNNTNINKNSVTITNSYNYGTIRAASASGLFAQNSAQNSDSANAREIEELYLASCNRGIISVQSFNGFTYSIKENEINYNLTNTNNVGKIVLRINGHTSVLDNNNEYIGARGFQITQEISPVNSTNGTFIYKLGQVIRQLDYNLDIELSNSNKIYDDGEYVKVYYVEKDNQAYYVFDDGYGNYSVSPNLSIAITAYSTSGSILGNAVLEND